MHTVVTPCALRLFLFDLSQQPLECEILVSNLGSLGHDSISHGLADNLHGVHDTHGGSPNDLVILAANVISDELLLFNAALDMKLVPSPVVACEGEGLVKGPGPEEWDVIHGHFLASQVHSCHRPLIDGLIVVLDPGLEPGVPKGVSGNVTTGIDVAGVCLQEGIGLDSMGLLVDVLLRQEVQRGLNACGHDQHIGVHCPSASDHPGGLPILTLNFFDFEPALKGDLILSAKCFIEQTNVFAENMLQGHLRLLNNGDIDCLFELSFDCGCCF